jgi:Peptidase family C25
MNRVSYACLLSCLWFAAIPSPGQDAGLAVRIETSQEGLHRIPGEYLKAYFALDRIDPERLSMTHDGQSVPIEVFGSSDGHFDASDEILFFAEAPRKRHSATETYLLTGRGNPHRFRPAPAASGAPDSTVEVQLLGRSGPGQQFDQLATVRQDVIRGPALSPWFVAVLAPNGTRPRADGGADPSTVVVPLMLEPRPMKGLPARIRLRVRGAMANGVAQKLAINVNGTDLPPLVWDTPLQKELLATIPHDVLRKENAVRLTNLSDVPSYSEPGNELSQRRRNDVLVERVEIQYDAPLVGPSVSGQQLILRFPPLAAEGQKTRVIKIERRQQEGYLIVEPRSGKMWRSTAVEIPADREVTLAVCSLGGAYLPEAKAIQPLRPTREHLSAAGGDYVIVTTSELKHAVAMLAEHRRADGFTPVVVEARELYDAFTHGAFHPAAIQKFLAAATLNWTKKPRYLLLAGDADLDVNWLNQRETIPAWMVMTDYNGFTATDSLHADVDGNGLADIPVGRIPVRSRDDLMSVTRRIIAFETQPPPGPWRQRLTFVAGEGRFGPMVDSLLEKAAAATLSEIPAKFDVRMTYGNPKSAWYWPADDFNAHLIRSFNEGALAFTYIGHGSPDAFDRVIVEGKQYPILTSNDIKSLDSQGRSPVMTIIACSTGRYDDPRRDCLAEEMLRKDGGPIAVIAASRISHPYPNALLGQGVAKTFFGSNSRVGDAFLAGTGAMVAGSKGMYSLLAGQFLSKAVDGATLVRDHAAIYNLFGDPAQKLPFPLDLEVEAPETAKPGSTIAIKAALPEGASGEASVTLVARRDRKLAPAAESGPVNASTESDPASLVEAVKARHARSNDHTVLGARFPIVDGALAASLGLPADLACGSYSIVVSLDGDGQSPSAAGSKKLKVEPAVSESGK